MKTRRLGSSQLEISEVGLGTWALGGPVIYKNFSVGWAPISEKAAIKTIRVAADVGMHFIDTADIYGNGLAETYIGKALEEMGDQGQKLVIATKVGFITDRDLPMGQNQDFSEKHLRFACENSLKRLRRDFIDLYQLHCVPLSVICQRAAFEVLEQLKKEGKIREYGVSIVTTDEALAAVEVPGICSVQIIFNIFRQKPIETVFPLAKKKGVGILARVPLASGLLSGKFKSGHRFEKGDHRSQGIPGETFSGLKFQEGLKAVDELKTLARDGKPTLAQVALAFTLNWDAVSATIPGVVSGAQVAENAAVSGNVRLSQQDLLDCRKVYEKYCRERMEKIF